MSRSLGPCWGTFWVVVMLTTVGIKSVDQIGEAVRRILGDGGLGKRQTESCNGRNRGALRKYSGKPYKTRLNHVRPPTALKAKRSGTAGAARSSYVYMAGDCGANKEAVMLPVITAF